MRSKSKYSILFKLHSFNVYIVLITITQYYISETSIRLNIKKY